MLILCPSTDSKAATEASLGWYKLAHTPTQTKILDKEVGYLPKVAKAFAEYQSKPIIAVFHSDLTIHEPGWDCRVLHEFRDPEVVLVSFFGARQLGREGIYKTPYQHTQLARGDCYSNLRDAEVHGQRFTEAMDVAMVDSFSLVIRRSFIDQVGGWPDADKFPPSHGSDMWLCMMAARHRKKVRLVGIDCTHSGGGVATGGFDYPAWAATTKWGSDQGMHKFWHEYLYNEFRDVLPIRR